MIEIPLQINPGHKSLSVLSQEDREALKAYHPMQILRAKLTGHKRPRSVQQNRWIHAIFRIVAENTEEEDWNTPEKVKRNVKMAMKFFKDDVVVHGNRVFFELRSFAFDRMEQNEADIKYNEAKMICAKKLGVDPETLEAQAQEEPF